MTHEIVDENAAMDQVVERLTLRFPNLDPVVIRTTVDEAHATMKDAHVRDFLPVLVEREAKKKLKKLAAA
ncbi:three-helix bundle dimerization domain-containing protein [Microbacterium sp. P03]|uniref:three-helix bundle dimerization domain-containing protein n=1 Tax=Microbacterium sp. P03 TaxID=3366946 RepID=UPI003746D034